MLITKKITIHYNIHWVKTAEIRIQVDYLKNI